MFKQKLNFIISHYGGEHQVDKLLEELGELISAIIKERQCSTEIMLDCVIDEIADVLIMIEQYMLIKGIKAKTVNDRKKLKVKRTLVRMTHENKQEEEK